MTKVVAPALTPDSYTARPHSPSLRLVVAPALTPDSYTPMWRLPLGS